MVDLPLPVLPMMAVVWPRRRTKSRSWRVASSASAKRNQACWKAQTASPSVWGRLPAPSVISGRWERTASIRSRQTLARGRSMRTIWAIIT